MHTGVCVHFYVIYVHFFLLFLVPGHQVRAFCTLSCRAGMGVDIETCTTAQYKAATRGMSLAERAAAAEARRRHQSREAAKNTRARRAAALRDSVAAVQRLVEENAALAVANRNLLAELYERQQTQCQGGSFALDPHTMAGSHEEAGTSFAGHDSWDAFISRSPSPSL
jgi:hypothetical protein